MILNCCGFSSIFYFYFYCYIPCGWTQSDQPMELLLWNWPFYVMITNLALKNLPVLFLLLQLFIWISCISNTPGVIQDVPDPELIVSFPIVDDPDKAAFLAWTTTPWTLPSNLALCVNANFVYVKVSWIWNFFDRSFRTYRLNGWYVYWPLCSVLP